MRWLSGFSDLQPDGPAALARAQRRPRPLGRRRRRRLCRAGRGARPRGRRRPGRRPPRRRRPLLPDRPAGLVRRAGRPARPRVPARRDVDAPHRPPRRRPAAARHEPVLPRPARHDEPTVVDVSMGRVTYGTVLHAAARGAPLPEGAARRPDGSAESDPAQVIADRAGIVPFGADQAYKGFALATVVELLCGALAGTDGYAAVALLLSRTPRPTPWPGCAASPRAAGSPATAARRRSTMRCARGTVAIPDDLWAWLADGPGDARPRQRLRALRRPRPARPGGGARLPDDRVLGARAHPRAPGRADRRQRARRRPLPRGRARSASPAPSTATPPTSSTWPTSTCSRSTAAAASASSSSARSSRTARSPTARWILHTRDAGTLYERFGFRHHERLMQRDRPAG